MQKMTYTPTATVGYAPAVRSTQCGVNGCHQLQIKNLNLVTVPAMRELVDIRRAPIARPGCAACIMGCQGLDLSLKTCKVNRPYRRPRVNGFGGIERSVETYVNTPLNSVICSGRCAPRDASNPSIKIPNDPRYGNMDSSKYNPIELVFGKPYNY
jgi:hypothetical protein